MDAPDSPISVSTIALVRAVFRYYDANPEGNGHETLMEAETDVLYVLRTGVLPLHVATGLSVQVDA